MAIPISLSVNEPMEVAEFQRILNLGLGRAILYLRQNDASPYRDAILFACLNVTVYDLQTEPSHSPYLGRVIRLSGRVKFFRPRILDALKHVTLSNKYLVTQLFELTLRFALEGDQEAKAIIYRKAKEAVRSGTALGVFAITALDGLDGLVWSFRQRAKSERPYDGNDDWQFSSYVDDFEKELGKDTVWNALNTVAAKNEHLQRFLSDMEHSYDSLRARNVPRATYETIEAALASNSTLPYGSRAWMEDETDAIMAKFAANLLAEQDPDRLLQRLRLFRWRPFPLDLQRLLQLAELGDNRISRDQLAIAAMRVLGQVHHADVRALAFRMIETGNSLGQAVGMLQSNFEPGDWEYITPLTKKTLDAEEYHHLGFSVRDLAQQYPEDGGATDALINLYEYGACSFCRDHVVEILHQLGKLPAWMLEECKYDSNDDLRKKARRGFTNLAS